MALNLPHGQTLFGLVKARYDAAKAAASLMFLPTEVAIVRAPGQIPWETQPYQLRYCPRLAKKSMTEKNNDEDNKTSKSASKKSDPSKIPPVDLQITNLPANSHNPSHFLVLHKYPIIAHHFVLATKACKKQTHFLEEDDLAMTYACLRAWEDGQDSDNNSKEEQERGQRGRRLFAFFDSGEHSGDSQPHRHIQFLPIEEMQAQQPANSDWSLLLDTIDDTQFVNQRLPFQHFTMRIPPDPTPGALLSIYKTIYHHAEYAVAWQLQANQIFEEPAHFTHVDLNDIHQRPFSYNLALTTTTMSLCPRRAAWAMVKNNWAKDLGYVAVNGTMLAGVLMVSGEKVWDFLRQGECGGTKLKLVLRTLGLPQGPSDADVRYEDEAYMGIEPAIRLR